MRAPPLIPVSSVNPFSRAGGGGGSPARGGAPYLPLFNGFSTVDDLQIVMMRRQGGSLVFRSEAERIVGELSRMGILQTESTREAKERIVREFTASPERTAALAGSAYPADPFALAAPLARRLPGPAPILSHGQDLHDPLGPCLCGPGRSGGDPRESGRCALPRRLRPPDGAFDRVSAPLSPADLPDGEDPGPPRPVRADGRPVRSGTVPARCAGRRAVRRGGFRLVFRAAGGETRRGGRRPLPCGAEVRGSPAGLVARACLPRLRRGDPSYPGSPRRPRPVLGGSPRAEPVPDLRVLGVVDPPGRRSGNPRDGAGLRGMARGADPVGRPLAGESPSRIRAYQRAAWNIGGLSQNVAEMTDEELRAIPGIGPDLVEKIRQFLGPGSVGLPAALRTARPSGQ